MQVIAESNNNLTSNDSNHQNLAAINIIPSNTYLEKKNTLKNEYRCEYQGCEKYFTSKVSLKKHSRKHIKKNIYKCEFPGCGHEFLQMRNLTIHQRLHVSDLLF